jgi:hypothetical protein
MPDMNGIDFAQIVNRKHDVLFTIYTSRGNKVINILS